MKEEEFQKKVLNKFGEIEKRLMNIEEKLGNIESAMNSMYEDIEDEEDEEYEGEEASSPEPEDNNIAGILPPHKNIRGYV
ncbi:MAG: hypothetical protein GW904_03480 [Candidatus Altiarchaeum hamiconexum]|uniref:Uncharacterized protein n=2 Tax=Candidatus Altarchaeum hamiconexum TaxID=1803513 RepID=A0A8J8CG83_9ARCH|nr:hypothetical protein [Candidatus Altarchaeum hamiconexum]NCN68789.1 hypothetical protein [Candidatus Altarchaeum hamiconexum]PJC13498.1 MAG: hypothetical protein CO063_04180 [Candidatus Altarchaeum sp. CG_4_9_14_0_8_um_filter_32_206]